jgi:hypothetical protein
MFGDEMLPFWITIIIGELVALLYCYLWNLRLNKKEDELKIIQKQIK